MIALVDSPVANRANIERALRHVGAEVRPTSDPAEIAAARKIVLPGVGSFGAAMAWLRSTGVDGALRTAVARGATILGICVGHQVLFESSEEMGRTAGLAVLPGHVEKLREGLPVPQIGWNRVSAAGSDLFRGIPDGSAFYFVHSYAAFAAPDTVATAEYGSRFTAAVQRGQVFGVQFHPEKSGASGLRVLRNFVELSCR